MTIVVEVKLLRAAAAEAAAVAATRAETVPVLSHVLLEADRSQLRLSATDLDMVVDRHVDVVEGETLRTTVSARLLHAIATKIPDGAQVSLAIEGEQLVISSGRSRFALTTLRADQFPEFPTETWDAEFELPAFDLAKLIDSIGFAICTEEARYYLNGIYLHAVRVSADDETIVLRAAATDGHRLARYQLALPDGAQSLPEAGVIIPRKAIGVIRKLCDAVGEGKVQIAVSANRIRIEGAETVLTSKLIAGTFPDYSRVIPTANDGLLRADKAALRESVERVTTISSDKTRAVKVDLVKETATLTVQSPENGTALEEVAIEFGPKADPSEGGALTIGFNSKYLLDVVSRINGDTMLAELGDAAAPVLLRDPDCDQQLFVLMPMRV